VVAKYKFEKEFVLSDLLKIYVNLNIKDILVNEIVRDDRYYKFEALIYQLSTAKKEEEEDETIFGEIPDQYLCNIIGTVQIGLHSL
jgi:hypothetical protein